MTTGLKYGHVLRAISSGMWALYRPTFDLMFEIAEMRASGQIFDPDEIAERLGAAKSKNGARAGAQRADYVAVVPIYGVISQKQNLMSQTSGGTSIDGVKSMFREALNDPEVGHIIFDIDSPGGTVDGVAELADEIRAARGEKPMTSVVNTAMFSAALWLGTQADEIVAMPTGQMGSIGIISTHTDDSVAREQMGVKRTVIAMPPGKADGWGGDPITDDAITEIREMQAELYDMFTGAVSKGRGASAKTVRDVWGKNARIFSAKAAKDNGLVDRIDTLDATVAKAARQLRTGNGSARAQQGRKIFAGGFGTTDQEIVAGLMEDEAIRQASDMYSEGMADGHDPDPEAEQDPETPAQEPTEVVTEEPVETPPDGEPTALTAVLDGLPFSQRLTLVAAEAEALAVHAARRAEMRADEGRGLSEETRAQLRRLEMAFHDLSIGAEAEPAQAGEAEAQPVSPKGVLDIYEAALRGGYQLPTN